MIDIVIWYWVTISYNIPEQKYLKEYFFSKKIFENLYKCEKYDPALKHQCVFIFKYTTPIEQVLEKSFTWTFSGFISLWPNASFMLKSELRRMAQTQKNPNFKVLS